MAATGIGEPIAVPTAQAYRDLVKGFLAVVVLALLVGGAVAAVAQGKDPFQPPSGFTEPVPGTTAPGDTAQPPAPSGPSNDGLSRTGQDVEVLITVGVLLLLIGTGLRVAGRIAGQYTFPPGRSTSPTRLKNTPL